MIYCHNLYRRFEEVKQDYYESLENISKNEKTVNGYYVSKLEEKLKVYSKRNHVLLVRSGTQALTLALLANGVKAGDEVIVTNYSCHASLSCVTVLDAIPVFCEVDKHGSMDPQYLDGLITDKTTALIATGLYGCVHKHNEINDFCRKHNITYINDAAQSYFATYNGQDSLELGDIACISFAENKPLPSLGTFGAVFTDDQAMYEKLRYMRKNGKAARHEPFLGTGVSGHPEEDKAAQILASTKHVDRWQKRRFEIVEYYDKEFASAGIPKRERYSHGAWNAHKYVIFPSDKIAMHDRLYADGIDSEEHYTENFSDLPWLNKPKVHMPWSDFFVKQSLTIPLNPHLTDIEVEKVVSAVIKNFI